MALLKGYASAFINTLNQITILYLAFLIYYSFPCEPRPYENRIDTYGSQREKCRTCKNQLNDKFFIPVFLFHLQPPLPTPGFQNIRQPTDSGTVR